MSEHGRTERSLTSVCDGTAASLDSASSLTNDADNRETRVRGLLMRRDAYELLSSATPASNRSPLS